MLNKLRKLVGKTSPILNTRISYFVRKKRRINLKNPETFDEKISWLKLFDYPNNDLVIQCSDKFLVREYVEKCGFAEDLNTLIELYDNPKQIQLDKLPLKSVIKWNNDCGSTIVFNKETDSFEDVKEFLINKGSENYYLLSAEMHYKSIVPKIIVEAFLDDGHGLIDYKVYCFNGQPVYIMVCLGRQDSETKFYFMDTDWKLQKINQDGMDFDGDIPIEKPKNLDLLLNRAKVMSQPFKFVRCDYYIVNDKLYFGELTFTPSSGIDPSLTEGLDAHLGELIKL